MRLLINEKVVQLNLAMQFLHDPTDRLKAHKEGKDMKEWKFECSKQSSKYKNDYFKKSGALRRRDLPSFWSNNSYCSISHSITSGWQSSNCSRVQIKSSDGGSCKRVPQKTLLKVDPAPAALCSRHTCMPSHRSVQTFFILLQTTVTNQSLQSQVRFSKARTQSHKEVQKCSSFSDHFLNSMLRNYCVFLSTDT